MGGTVDDDAGDLGGAIGLGRQLGSDAGELIFQLAVKALVFFHAEIVGVGVLRLRNRTKEVVRDFLLGSGKDCFFQALDSGS